MEDYSFFGDLMHFHLYYESDSDTYVESDYSYSESEGSGESLSSSSDWESDMASANTENEMHGDHLNDDNPAQPSDEDSSGDEVETLVMPAVESERLTNVPQEDSSNPELPPDSKKEGKRPLSPNFSSTSVKKACHDSKSDDGMVCIICFEPWCNSGDHRLVSLKCGHLFGSKCIERWIKQNSSCPQCNKKSLKKDIRILYAKSLVTLDTSERDRALGQLEQERERCRNLEVENSNLRYTINSLESTILQLRQELTNVKTFVPSCSKLIPNTRPENFLELVKTVVLSQDKGCRVMAYSERLQLLVVSQCSSNPLFPGYGVRKLDLVEMRSSEFFLIHQTEIRDLAFNPVSTDLLLSVSVDRSAKLFNVVTNTVLHSYHHTHPVWACCWNTDNPHQFFVGLQNGALYLYDTIHQGDSEPVSLTANNPPLRMITKLLYIRKNSLENHPHGGLMVTTLSGCMFYESRSQQYIPHFLVVEGRFTSVVMDDKTSHILLASRISKSFNYSRLILCTLSVESQTSGESENLHNKMKVNTVQILKSNCPMKNLSHSVGLFQDPHDSSKLIIVVCKESPCEVVLWDSEGKVVKKFATNDPVLDVLNIVSGNKFLLCLLSAKSVTLYEWK